MSKPADLIDLVDPLLKEAQIIFPELELDSSEARWLDGIVRIMFWQKDSDDESKPNFAVFAIPWTPPGPISMRKMKRRSKRITQLEAIAKLKGLI